MRFQSFWFLSLHWKRKFSRLRNIFKTRMCFIWGSSKFLRFPSFRFRPLYWNRKLRKLRNIFKTYKFQRICFIWGSWKFPRFPSFGPYIETENLENSAIFLTLVNLKGFTLVEEVRNFWGFWVFDFRPDIEIKNWQNSEIFSRLVNLKECDLFEKLGNFEVSKFLILDLTFKLKTLKPQKYFQNL